MVGEKASRNGLMWLWLNPYLEVTINPKIPTELGFYDLRFSENREAQAILAQKAGISAFLLLALLVWKWEEVIEYAI